MKQHRKYSKLKLSQMHVWSTSQIINHKEIRFVQISFYNLNSSAMQSCK
uniref:Uncharacterized protein n=1 Tax=Nelumbo nucifera TaxID=4432 RepID=A0A822ZRD8_NELNU|nr:TPA_asm: hypothetical protein HUJ06_018451 [Nelumbo nucifera]